MWRSLLFLSLFICVAHAQYVPSYSILYDGCANTPNKQSVTANPSACIYPAGDVWDAHPFGSIVLQCDSASVLTVSSYSDEACSTLTATTVYSYPNYATCVPFKSSTTTFYSAICVPVTVNTHLVAYTAGGCPAGYNTWNNDSSIVGGLALQQTCNAGVYNSWIGECQTNGDLFVSMFQDRYCQSMIFRGIVASCFSLRFEGAYGQCTALTAPPAYVNTTHSTAYRLLYKPSVAGRPSVDCGVTSPETQNLTEAAQGSCVVGTGSSMRVYCVVGGSATTYQYSDLTCTLFYKLAVFVPDGSCVEVLGDSYTVACVPITAAVEVTIIVDDNSFWGFPSEAIAISVLVICGAVFLLLCVALLMWYYADGSAGSSSSANTETRPLVS